MQPEREIGKREPALNVSWRQSIRRGPVAKLSQAVVAPTIRDTARYQPAGVFPASYEN
jgi:hypothetical protein